MRLAERARGPQRALPGARTCKTADPQLGEGAEAEQALLRGEQGVNNQRATFAVCE